MIILEEHKAANLSNFIVHAIDDNGDVIHSRVIAMPLYEVQADGGNAQFILYNDEYVPNSDVYRYLNIEMKGRPLTSRRKSAHAIRLLYVYLSYSNRTITGITREVRDGLRNFLKGVMPVYGQYHLMTVRSNATVNAYMSCYRNYLDFLDIDCKSLTRSKSITVTTLSEGDFSLTQNVLRYDSSLTVNSHKTDYLPAFISPKEFARLWDIARRHNDRTAMLMMYLMYCHGLRRGECLGITVEDLKTINCDGKDIPIIVLRNRLSDRDDQKAKNRIAAEDASIYRNSDYIGQYRKDPYSRICLVEDDDFYRELWDYVEESSEDAILNHEKNYLDAIADIVEKDFGARTGLDENHYIFLNRNGKRLSGQTWDYTLKKYFLEAGIPVVTGHREGNLSHRFRHGFAMLHAHFMKPVIAPQNLQKLMRHNSIKSTMKYYNLTPEEEVKMKTDLQQSIYESMDYLKVSFEKYVKNESKATND